MTVDDILAHKLNGALDLLSLLVKQRKQDIHVRVIMWQPGVEVIMPPLHSRCWSSGSGGRLTRTQAYGDP